MEQTENATNQDVDTPQSQSQSCLTVPSEMAANKRRMLRCPECLSEDKLTLPNYTINTGYRATRRMAIKSSVVIVFFHLGSLQTTAEALVAQVCAALGAFELHLVVEVLELASQLDELDSERILQELLPKAPFHVVVVFLTESDPRGGWWVSPQRDGKAAQRASEKGFLEFHLDSLTKLARSARSARLFIISCGMNMFNEKTVGSIFHAINTRPWHSIVFPSVPAIMPWQYASIFPELFTHLYYFGAPLKSSLLRTWAKSREARRHTGFILMDRVDCGTGLLEVSRFEHAPHTSRPYGFDLPMLPSLCGCWHKSSPDSSPHWSPYHVSQKFREVFSFFVSTCCSFELHIAIYTGCRTVRDAHGTKIVEELWDTAAERFHFDSLTMVAIKMSPARKTIAERAERPRHTEPWTIAGQREAHGSNMVTLRGE
ncbi:hypothetical protein FRC08_009472 [Ceratobasidium sp. 394]|nr:hypothetical protein FRC08_009472 [Ceratobasidium sp. 394]